MLILEWLLRAFGAFWVVAGIYTLRTAWASRLIEKAGNKIEPGLFKDSLRTNFLFAVGFLTFCSGISLVIASIWSPVIIGVLVLSQVIYFYIQNRRRATASDREEIEDTEVSPRTRNAFVFSVIIWVFSVFVFSVWRTV